MKALLTLGLILASTFTQAAVSVSSCDSIMGSGHHLDLIIANGELKQIRTLGRRPLVPVKIQGQQNAERIVYSILGSSELLELDARVLTGERGDLRLAGDVLSCF